MIVAVFGSSRTTPGDPAYADAVALGRALATAGFGVATGGYGGAMEAASKGAVDAGGHAIGVTAPELFPMRDGPNRYVSEERPQRTLTERIHELVETTIAAIALPGSIGTLTELLVYWNDAYLRDVRGVPARPIITIGETWAHLVPDITRTVDTKDGFVAHAASIEQVVPMLRSALGMPQ